MDCPQLSGGSGQIRQFLVCPGPGEPGPIYALASTNGGKRSLPNTLPASETARCLASHTNSSTKSLLVQLHHDLKVQRSLSVPLHTLGRCSISTVTAAG